MSLFQRFYGIVYIFYVNGVTHVIHVHGLKVRLLGWKCQVQGKEVLTIVIPGI
jgi:hypothetical protein